jgi:hypothetical protein
MSELDAFMGDADTGVTELSLLTSTSQDLTDDDVDAIALPQDFQSSVTVASLTAKVGIEKPNRMEFVRRHLTWVAFLVAVLRIGINRFYVLTPELYKRYADEAIPVVLVPMIDRVNRPFLWPIRVATSGKELDDWNARAHEAAELARTKWIRVTASEKLGNYKIEVAEDDLGEPCWPEDIPTMQRLVAKALKDVLISDLNHPILNQLAGRNAK